MRNCMSRITGLTAAGAHQARKLIVLAVAALLLCWPMPDRVQAAAGDLDPSFGNGGRVTTDFFGDVDDMRALLIQGDGRIIAIGNVFGPDNHLIFALARYNINGSLDQSFGSGGKVTTEIAPTESLSDAALQTDGKIVVAGGLLSSPGNFDLVIARYNTNGNLDPTFGAGGVVITDFSGGDEFAFALAIQPDGKIVLGSSGFSLVRYNADGSLDTSFGSGGRVFTDFSPVNQGVLDVIVQADGKIIAGGFAVLGGTGSRFALARYNADGSLDMSFGSGGKVITDFVGDEEWISDFVIQPDGKIIAAGRNGSFFVPPLGLKFALARYNPDGSLDTNFGDGGKVSTSVINGEIRYVALQTDGKIVAGGGALARYNADGSLDTSFGGTGFIHDEVLGLAIQSDGKIVTGGFVNVGENRDELTRDFAVSRYDAGFAGQSFDRCIQDDSNGSTFQFNSTSGDYRFTNCSGVNIAGAGAITQRGGVTTLRHTAADRRVLASVDASSGRATATIQLISQGTTFTITDRNTANDTCACQ